MLFLSGQKAFEMVVVYFEMSWKGLTFQDTDLVFQRGPGEQHRAVLLQQSAVHPGSARVAEYVGDLLYKAF